MSGFVSLELQIISINVISLFGSISSWFKQDQQLEKISNLSISDELNIKDIDWLKTVLSWIVIIQSVINRVSVLAYIINIYTIATRKWQNLLLFWMVLYLLRDVVLEIVVVIITFLQWRKGSISTLLFIEFFGEKTIWLVISTYKLWTIFKWYTRLRREAKIRKFTKIARRNIASIVNIPGQSHFLNDEYHNIASVRRNKYTSLLSLNKLLEKSSNKINFDLRISKSLTTYVTNDDSHDSNDINDSNANDFSVAEKSMKILGVTAEDVMDACSRIQERSYWSEQDVITKTPKTIEEVMVPFLGFSLGKDVEEMNDALGNEQKDNIEETANFTLEKNDVIRVSQIEKNKRKDKRKIDNILRNKPPTINIEKAVDCNLLKEIIMQNFEIKRGEEEEDDKIILIDKAQNVSLTETGDVASDKINNRVKSREFYKFQENEKDFSSRKKKEEETEKLTKMEHCSSSSTESKDGMNMKAKPCASLVRKLEAKHRLISRNQKEKWLDLLDKRKYFYRNELMPTNSDANKKENSKNSRTSLCVCHRALKKNIDASKKEKYVKSSDINHKNIKHHKKITDRKEFKPFLSIVNEQKDKTDGCDSALKYSETYCLRKQIQNFEGSSTKQRIAWGSMSLAQTARPSGYSKDVISTNKPINNRRNYQRNVEIDAYDEPSDFSNVQYKLKRRIRSRPSIDPRTTYKASFTEKNYARSEKRETKIYNGPTLLANKREKTRRGHYLSSNRKLSCEESEAVELKALRAFNELTLLEDKKKMEARKNRDLSLNFEHLTRESVMSEMEVSESYNDLTLPDDEKETNARRGYNFSPSCKQSIEESSALKISNEHLSSEDKGELKIDERHVSSKYEENIEISRSDSNHTSEINREETRILSFETRGNANDSFELNERYAGRTYTSLNLREVTRNIQWTVHPRGIILTNKNLHHQFPENERLRESQRRDIVDDNIVGALHRAFFFKPELVTRIFQRARTRIDPESIQNFPTSSREDFNTEFVCQVNNETVAQWDRDSSSFDFERILGDRSDLGESSFPGANGSNNRVFEDGNRDLCIIFIDREQAYRESETAIIEDSSILRYQEDPRSSAENMETTNLLLVCVLRDFGVEISERIEEYGNNIIASNANSRSSNVSANETSLGEEDNNRRDAISSHQTLHSNNSRPDDAEVASSSYNSHNLTDKKHINAIDISSKKRIYENNSLLTVVDNNTTSQLSDDNNNYNNNQFDTLFNESEKSILNRIPENASRLSFPDSPSLISKENNFNQSIPRSNDEEELQIPKLGSQGGESIMNLKMTNYDAIPQFENGLNLLETMVRDGAGNDDKDSRIYEKANIFSNHQFFRINQDERLQRDDSFYSTFERKNDGTETPVSLGDGSTMEEFSNSIISPGTSSNI